MDKQFTDTKTLLNRIEEIEGIGVWIQNTEDNELWWSDQTCKIFGIELTNNKLGFDDFLKIVTPEYRKIISKTKQQALLSDKSSYSIDYEIISKDKQHRTIHEEAIIERDKGHHPTHIIGIVRDITQRKKTEKEPDNSEKNFRLLFRNSPLGIYIANTEGKILEINHSALDILGSPSAEETKKINVLHFPPLVKNGYANDLLKCIQSGEIVTKEHFYQSKWGKKLFLLSYIIPLKDRYGKIVKIYTIMEDISERKKAEKALKESEKKYKKLSHEFQLMSDNIPDLVWAKDLEGRYTFVNKAICEKLLIAKDTDEPIGKTDIYFTDRQRKLHPERKDWHTFGEICVNSDEVVLKNKRPQRFDEYGNVQGKFLFLDVYKAPIINENGKIVGTVGHARIVTKEKETEKKLIDSEYRFKALSEATYEAVFITEKGVCIEANEAASRMFGYSYDELIGKYGPKVIAPESRELVEKNILSGYEKPYDAMALRKDGTKFPAEFRGRTVVYKGRKARITTVRDLTERKKTEQALKEKEAKLQESIKTKDKFFSIIAHDLKTPFNTLLGFSDLLYNNFEEYSKEEQKEFLNIIRNSIKSSQKLLENLLVWSRSQRGTIEYKPEKINLYFLANEIGEALNDAILKKSLSFKNNIPPGFYVYADKAMLSTIIRNLLSNAVKFTNRGGHISINAQPKTTEDNHKYAEISVADSGIGIHKKMLTKLFDVGETISTRGTENEKGTGLGLVLCKEFVEKHNGKIWVKSKEGTGSTFYFTIPFNPEDKIFAENKMKTYTILIVDDEHVNYLYINLILKNSGLNLNTFYAKTAKETIEFCKENPDIDIILMDIRMPNMDGFEITRQIRKFNKDIVIVAQTAYVLEKDRKKALEAGCNDYISKPIDKRKLLGIIEKFLSGK